MVRNKSGFIQDNFNVYQIKQNQCVDIQCKQCLKYYEILAADLNTKLFRNAYYVFICDECKEKNHRGILEIQRLREETQQQQKKQIEQQQTWQNNSFVIYTEFISYE